MKTPIPEPSLVDQYPYGINKMFTESQLRAAMRDAFNEGIEEAAKVCQREGDKRGLVIESNMFSSEIRKLKETP